MKREILISSTPQEARVAILEDDILVEFLVERPDAARSVGDIYLGEVQAVLPGIQAAFVDIGTEKAAFLHASDVGGEEDDDEENGGGNGGRRQAPPIQDSVKKGQKLLVQVSKEAISTKGPRVTAQISLPGRFLVHMPQSGHIGVSRKIEDREERSRLRLREFGFLFQQPFLLGQRPSAADFAVYGQLTQLARYLDRLLQDLLDTARIEAGQFELEYSVHDVTVLVKDAVELHKNWPIPHHFRLEIPDQPLLCMCDEARISQVLTNLLSNAMKYSPDRSTITVKAAADEELVIVEVTDQGIGIDSSELKSIFKPFRRTTATRGVYPGTGLGLSASRRIIESHGGRLEVESRLGAGSTFTVFLPIHPRQIYLREQAAPILEVD